MTSYSYSKTIKTLFVSAGLSILFLLQISFLPAFAQDEQLEFKESKYNNIYIYKRGPLIAMTFGHNKRFYTETVYDTRDIKALPVIYTRFMTASLAYTAKTANLLEIGFGGGRTTSYLHEHLATNTVITSVELDPVVVDLAKKYFDIKANKNFEIVVADGRRYVAASKKKYDVIMIDAYRGPFVPFHLLTKEFFQIVKSKLTEDGVAVQNIEPSTMVFDSALKTIGTVFQHIDIYSADGNIVAVAYNGKKKNQEELLARAKQLQETYNFKYDLHPMLNKRRIITATKSGKILTDDFAPVESLKAIKRHNRKLDDISEEAVK